MIKTLQNIQKQDRMKMKVPKSVQDAIPIQRIWADGIFQFGSKFSKTITFSDINYAIASKEDKTQMFLGYSELLNALDAGATTIKEKKAIKDIIKEKKPSAPKELIRRGVPAISKKAEQEISEAAQIEHQPEEQQQQTTELPQIRRHYASRHIKEKHKGTKTKSLGHQQPEGSTIPQGQEPAVNKGREAAKKKARQENQSRLQERTVGDRYKAQNSYRQTDSASIHQARTSDETIPPRTIKTRATDSKSVSQTKETAKSISTKTIKTRRADHKSVEQKTKYTAKMPKTRNIKTTAKTAAKPTQASITVKKAGQKATKTAQKSAKQAGQAALKSIVSSLKSLLAFLGAGGSAVLVIIVVVMLVASILLSPMGIFFSGESESDYTLQQVVGELNRSFSERITEIENSVAHDDVEQTGQRAKWKEILSVYAVKVSTDAENPLEVMTMDEERAALLQDIFWDMNTIAYTTETYTEEIAVEVPSADSTDEDGITEETQTVERVRLIITITGKTAFQTAEEYGFNEEQLGYLTELLSEDYEELWYCLPFGGSDDIVEVALSQVGNVGGEPYWSWYGYTSRVAWCACFVSWCGEQCDLIESGAMPKFSYCQTGVQWFKNEGRWADRTVVPEPGFIIFFDWNSDGHSDHVGIVEYSDGGVVYTIEGNSSDACRQLSYSVGSYKIMGYGFPV